ncbi:ATP-dependent helicase HrpB [Actinomyces faecalis]|uniref:ATP-dependent helicase HrpB n=1 Tax=Actinomyces faecalis TaxID=2722820 RepID=UPI0015534B4A|nr:ATP-dependent helicase HrpB [Actinomyces faecalis]
MSSTPSGPPPDPIARLLADPPQLPVVAGLPHLRELLTTATTSGQARSVVVTAPPGTGKTTLVPPLVADVARQSADVPGSPVPGRVLVTQPRRVAARAAARRLASLLGEKVGQSVGYAVRGDRRASASTRIEVVTAGLALRRLQADPDLPGVSAVVLDEVHERSLEGDLLLALLLDARALREDLMVVAMSATVDLARLPRMLGEDGAQAPVLDVPSALHPLQERWAPPPASAPRLGPRGVPREFLAHVAATTLQALEDPGDVLVFLPGAREVDDVVARLHAQAPRDVDVLPLHGRLGPKAQDEALAPSPPGRRRVVVSTNVAESSLTVPGVRVVVDSTLAREPRVDVASDISGLVTVGASRAEGTQRGGRAGREGPGVVVRCCSPADWARSPQAPTPEILSSDLTRTALELAVWGAPGGHGLAWIDAPPPPAMAVAARALDDLGLVTQDGGVTPLGRAVAAVPTEVRQARALLLASRILGARRAAETTALLTSGLRASGGDLTALARSVRHGGEGASLWREEARRLERAAGHGELLGVDELDAVVTVQAGGETGEPSWSGADAVGLVAALAHPQWIARRRGPVPAAGQEARYVSVGGVGMRVAAGSALTASQWLAVAEVDRAPGRSEALVRGAAPVDQDLALAVAGRWLEESEEVAWEEDRLRARQVRSLGAITLSQTPLSAPSADAAANAVVARCLEEGLGFLPWGGGEHPASVLRARLTLLHKALGEPWPAVDDEALLARVDEWLVPAVRAAASRDKRLDVGRIDLTEALRGLLPWPEAARLDELAPERLTVPSGSQVRLSYLDEQGEVLERPVLAVRVQECFGWKDTPRVADSRVSVLLHLLSPARRPVAVTDDLHSFWEGPYQQVRRELRGRYPKHAWPEDPWTAPAVRGTRRRG